MPTNFLQKKKQRTLHSADKHKNCFSFRVAPEWNNLPAPMKNANTINRFKNLLDRHYLNGILEVLPSERRLRAIKSKTNRFNNTFFPKAVKFINNEGVLL